MKVAIMQPYLFPYIGYWQLIAAADTFILLDDVNYICRGWINRNRYYCDGRIQYFNFPIINASQNRRICETQLLYTLKQRNDMKRTFSYAYRNAPYLYQAMEQLAPLLLDTETDLTAYSEKTICRICQYLCIDTPIIRASSLRPSKHSTGETGIIELCKVLEADTYINPIGGKDIYHRDRFTQEGIQLMFLSPNYDAIHTVIGDTPVDLSIIDLMMRLDHSTINCMLYECCSFL